MRATYAQEIFIDDNGNELDLPHYKPASKNDKNFIALIDWGENEIAPFTSPMHYYALSACFNLVGKYIVSQMDKRITSDGIMSFTLKRDYSASYLTNCTGIWSENMMKKQQKTFMFEEILCRV